jgi:hypothetical protein
MLAISNQAAKIAKRELGPLTGHTRAPAGWPP